MWVQSTLAIVGTTIPLPSWHPNGSLSGLMRGTEAVVWRNGCPRLHITLATVAEL